MTDTDALTAYLRQLERIKDDWDDRKYAEIEKDCLLPLWQLCRRMQETEQDITRSSSAQSTNLHT